MSNWQSLVGVCALLAVGSPSHAADPIVRFEDSVLPILKDQCSECHGGEAAESGLDVLSRDHLLEGGDSGPALVRGSAEQSLLFQRITAGEMPPEEPKLDDSQINAIRRWIDQGALAQGELSFDPSTALTSVSEAEVLSRVFFTHCISCHGKWKQEAGLDLRSTEAMKRGGKSGPALVPGDPKASLIYRRLLADEMPPKTNVFGDSTYVRRVAPDDLARLRKWIEAGAPGDIEQADHVPTPAQSEPSRRRHWAFAPVVPPDVPQSHAAARYQNPIDKFVVDRLASINLQLSPGANKLALMRRAYFDLIGLPPTEEEADAYLRDEAPDAYDRLIDRLLASPRYGERWAQHWLDAAGYADSHGKIDRDQFRPYLWRYRDYVIRSFNDDKPYSDFLAEQIAGDEIVRRDKEKLTRADQLEKLIATGFLLTASDATDEAAFNFVPNRLGVLAEQLDILSTAVMGLTLECARCHNHKFDPISQKDYYRFSAIFQSALDPYDWRVVSQVYYPSRKPLDRFYQRYIYRTDEREPEEITRFNSPLKARIERLQRGLQEKTDAAKLKLQSAGEKVDEWSADEIAQKSPEFKRELDSMRAEIAALQGRVLDSGVIHGVEDLGGEPTPVFLLRRGDPLMPGARVRPGVPDFLDEVAGPFRAAGPGDPRDSTGARLALASWLTSPAHPLTARVMVNRVWQHHFGKGLVSTSGNFGAKGAPPSNQKLLDWLAAEFMQNGWRMKALHRLIMTSSTYRQQSQPSAAQLAADSDNVNLSRFPYQRLDGEAVRDALLAVSGQLDDRLYGPPVSVNRSLEGEVCVDASSPERRSIYLARLRMRPVTMIELFDGPEMTPNCLERTRSTVPTQALQLHNSEFVQRCAAALADKVISASPDSIGTRIESAYRLAFCRSPSTQELGRDERYLSALHEAWRSDSANPAVEAASQRRAWQSYCHALLNSPEFIYID